MKNLKGTPSRKETIDVNRPTNIYDLPWDSFQSRYNIKRKKRKKKRHATSACRDYPIYRNIVACNAEVRDRVIRKGYIPFRSAKRCIPKCIYVQRTVCSGESVVSSLTHRLGADLPREKYGATAAAMRYEEKQSAVRFHVPEAGINERCLGAALPLSFRLLRDACTRTQSFGLHNRGTRHRERAGCARERHLRFDGVARGEARPTTRERNPTATRRIVVQPERLCASRNSMVKANCTVDRPEKY